MALFLRWLGARPLDRASVLDWIDWYSGRAGQASVVRRFAAVRAYALWRGSTATDAIRLRHPSAPVKQPFDLRDLQALLAACQKPHERALVLLLADTGLRLGELVRLRRDDLDFEQGLVYVLGKGGKRRVVGVSERTVAALRLCLDGRAYPWPSQRTHGPLTADGIRRVLQQLGRRAGVEHVHPHRFRTTFACRFLEEGGALESLQVLMGHQRIEQTLHYGKWVQGRRALAQQRRLALSAGL